jgi:capsular polysaccharide transport system permease protein
VYYGLFATDRYVSNAQVTVKTAGQGSIGGDMGSLLSGLVSTSGSQEAYVVQEYIRSPDILRELQSWLDLRAQWSRPSIDPISRLGPNASDEDFLDYYRDMITATYDAEKGVINLAVQGYSRDDANALATAIIELSDDMVNRMSDQIREDTLSFARQEVERAEERLQEARLDMKRFQNRHGDLNPAETASAIGGIIANLESRLAEVRTEMSAKSSYLRPNSSAMKALEAQERAIQEQLQQERQRLTGTEQGSSASDRENYSELLVDYEELRVQEELALKSYEAAQRALETARAEASRKQMYLVSFVSPTRPDASAKPDGALNTLVAFLGGLAVFAVVALVVAAVREHARF